jgi:hypothetical protein
VTPGIFQRYVAERSEAADEDLEPNAWRQYQRCFERLGLHEKRPDGRNIWTCKVQGPRKTSSLNGYLLQNARELLDVTPANNPFLTVVS